MNPKIKELLETTLGQPFAEGRIVCDTAHFEKFADLILQECITTCEEGGQFTVCAAQEIKEHFGLL